MIAPVVTFQFSALLSVLITVVVSFVTKEPGPAIKHFPSSSIAANVVGLVITID